MKEGWGRARRVRTLAPEAQESEFESPEHTYKKNHISSTEVYNLGVPMGRWKVETDSQKLVGQLTC